MGPFCAHMQGIPGTPVCGTYPLDHKVQGHNIFNYYLLYTISNYFVLIFVLLVLLLVSSHHGICHRHGVIVISLSSCCHLHPAISVTMSFTMSMASLLCWCGCFAIIIMAMLPTLVIVEWLWLHH